MRPIAVLLMVVTASLAASVADSDTEEWEEYKIKYGKRYPSPEEDLKREELFRKRIKEIKAHNERYHQGLESYKQGTNQFTDLTPEEIQMRMGIKGLKADEPIASERMYQPTGNPLPSSIDWREKNVVTPVKDQGGCGSSWAFSATGSMEGQHALKTGKLVSLSEKQLVDCETQHHGCHGGLPTHAFAYVEKTGIEGESDYPYFPSQGQCRFNKSDVKATFSSYKQIAVGDEKALEDAIAHVGPISVALDAFYLQKYAGGIVDSPYCDPTALQHNVLIVGYGVDSATGTPYWIVKNSWGSQWGEQGYFRIAKGKDMCGIARTASYPVV